MAIINNLLLLMIALAFVVMTVGFLLVISKNVRQGMLFRQKLAARMRALRMDKMLAALGMDLSSYLHNLPASRVIESANRCQDCTATDECDDSLAAGTLAIEAIDFCPNQDELSHFMQAESARKSAER